MRFARSRAFIVGLAGAALLVVILANAHLVYVATNSQPRCVPHVKAAPEAGPGAFSAAQPSC
jgi:hypothetical protein